MITFVTRESMKSRKFCVNDAFLKSETMGEPKVKQWVRDDGEISNKTTLELQLQKASKPYWCEA